MTKVKIRDINLNYEIYGSGEPTVVLLTGLGGTMSNWTDNPGMIDALKSKHQVVIMDNRGAGETDEGEIEYVTIRTMAEDVIGLMDYLGIEKAVISGGSMGGMITQQIAVDFPERVEKILLNATWPGGPDIVKPVQEMWEYLTVPGCGNYDYLKLTNPLLMLFAQKTINIMPEDTLNTIAKTYFGVRATGQTGFHRQQIALRDFNVSERLQDIKCPTLITHGLYDCLIPCENAITLAKKISNAKFVLLPNSSHASIEDTEYMIAENVKFIDEN